MGSLVFHDSCVYCTMLGGKIMFDPTLQAKQDQLLADMRDEALQDPAKFISSPLAIEALARCMISVWLNERDRDNELT